MHGYISQKALERLPNPNSQSTFLCFPYLSCCSLSDLLDLLNGMIKFLTSLNTQKELGLKSVLTYDSFNQCNILYLVADFSEKEHIYNNDPFNLTKIKFHEINRQKTFLSLKEQDTFQVLTHQPFNYASDEKFAQPSRYGTQIILNHLLQRLYFNEKTEYPSNAFYLNAQNYLMINRSISVNRLNQMQLIELHSFLNSQSAHIHHRYKRQSNPRESAFHRMLIETEKPESTDFKYGCHLFLPIGELMISHTDKVKYFEKMLEILAPFIILNLKVLLHQCIVS